MAIEEGFNLGQAATGLISNLGVFAPTAWLGYRVIIWYREDLKADRERINDLTDSVIKLMGDIATAIRGTRPGGS